MWKAYTTVPKRTRAIQSISKEADSLTRVEFYSLMEQVFALPAVQELVSQAMQGHEAGGER